MIEHMQIIAYKNEKYPSSKNDLIIPKTFFVVFAHVVYACSVPMK